MHPPHPHPRRVPAGALTVLLAAVLGGGHAFAAGTAEPPTVSVVAVTRAPSDKVLSLPGSVHAFEEAVIYARVTGYLKRWLVDIGEHVKAGQVLAEIDTPDLDQQLAEARQRVEQSAANLQLAQSTADRYRKLLLQQAVSPQEVDERVSDLQAKRAMYEGARANVERLRELAAFKLVRAPFSGVIGARNLEKTARGALIDSGNRQADGWLYRINLIDPLRVRVAVPQTYVALVHKGGDAQVSIREFPGRIVKGSVARTAETLDAASHTLLTEVFVPNPKGDLFPGLYADVKLSLSASQAPLVIPGAALLTGAGGARVAVLDDKGFIRMRKVRTGRDLGKVVEVLAGLSEGDRVIASPSDNWADGTRARLAPSTGAPASSPAKAQPGPRLASGAEADAHVPK